MTEDEQTVLIILGVIACLPADEQKQVKGACDRIRALRIEVGEKPFLLAIGLIGAEEAAKAVAK
jgi:hypothetical protein